MVAVIALAAIVAFSACPAAAVDHNDGATWIYGVVMSVDVGPYAVRVYGNLTYMFQTQRPLIVGTDEFDVNAILKWGELSGTMDMFGEPFLRATVMITGCLYEATDGAGIVREETDMLIDASIESGSGAWSIQQMNRSVETYTPPYLSGFRPESVELGDQWIEAVTIDREVTTWENGTEKGTMMSSSNTTHEISVGGNTFSVGTPAGLFECISVTVVDENGDYELRWWSNDVHGCVTVGFFSEGEGWPNVLRSMVLDHYEEGEPESMLWVALVGIIVAAIAVVVLVLVLLRIRHPKDS